jgi:hypothetical protein
VHAPASVCPSRCACLQPCGNWEVQSSGGEGEVGLAVRGEAAADVRCRGVRGVLTGAEGLVRRKADPAQLLPYRGRFWLCSTLLLQGACQTWQHAAQVGLDLVTRGPCVGLGLVCWPGVVKGPRAVYFPQGPPTSVAVWCFPESNVRPEPIIDKRDPLQTPGFITDNRDPLLTSGIH